ncbi:alginate export family protein [Novosphingobium sp.]|uniref:alginate export family protein n=1 Tax=Novosphingobium sp. TaxID=1874826 RepID=UPI0025E188AD|nr:alginate export family protein [Novosphingobium sp.]
MPRLRPSIARSLAPAGLALVSAPAVAAAPTLQAAIGNPSDFHLSGSVRLRYETLDGQSRAGFAADDEQLAMRTIIAAEYHHKALRIGAELYDSRAWLAPPGSAISANDVNAFEFVQAYVGADLGASLGAGSDTKIKAGRMTLNLGSTRLVASDDYRNATNGYTGLRADVKAHGVAATLIYVLPQMRLPDDPAGVRSNKVAWDRESFDVQLWGSVVARPRAIAGATAELTYLHFHEVSSLGRPNRERQLDTYGGRLVRAPAPGHWDFEVEGYHQTGSIATTTAPGAARLPVAASFVRAGFGYAFANKAKLRLSLAYDYASGDGPGGHYARFDTLFGSRRADLAPAGIYNAIGRTNISSPEVRAEIAPDKRFDAFVGYRALWLAEPGDAFSTTGVRDASERSGRFAGHQVDMRLRYWLIPGALRGEVDAVWLAKGRFLSSAPNAPHAGDTHYLSVGLFATF